MKIEPPSLNSGNAFCTVNSVARVQPESGIEVLLGDLAELALLARPGTCPQHVDGALFPPDRVEQTVQIVQVGRISLHAGHVPADQLDGFIQSFLPPTRDENVSSFVNEQLGTGQRHTT
jgi:hypothetical protein